MKTIDLEKIMREKAIGPKELAAELFPANKFQKMALERVIKGDSTLDVNQLSRLSSFTDIPVGELFLDAEIDPSAKWEILGTPDKLTFSLGDYRADLCTESWTTKLYHTKSIFHTRVDHDGKLPLSQYFEMLNSYITKNNK